MRRGGAGQAWARVLPFGVFIGLLAAEPYLAKWVGPALDPRWLYGARAGLTALAIAVLWPRYVELRSPVETKETPAGQPRARQWLLAASVGVGVFVLWITLDFAPFVTGPAGDGFDPRVDGGIHWGFALTRLAGAALVVPVMEELFWRSFLMRWLERPKFLDVDPAGVGWKALVLSSAVFALEHRLWLAGLIAGLAYGELYRRTRSLWVTILAHAVTNGALGAYVLATGRWGFW